MLQEVLTSAYSNNSPVMPQELLTSTESKTKPIRGSKTESSRGKRYTGTLSGWFPRGEFVELDFGVRGEIFTCTIPLCPNIYGPFWYLFLMFPDRVVLLLSTLSGNVRNVGG